MSDLLKKSLSVLASVILLFGAVPLGELYGPESAEAFRHGAFPFFSQKASAFDASGQCGKDISWGLDISTGVCTVSGTGAMRDYDPYSPNWSRTYKDYIKSIVIEDGVTRIGNMAFSGCDKLESVTFGKDVTSIGETAFFDCSQLKNVIIPDGITEIDYQTFQGCSGLESVTIPDSVVLIDQMAFTGCSGLKSIDLPDKLESIGNYAFSGCVNLESVVIPDGVATIEWDAFRGCIGLKDVTLGSGLTELMDRVFYGCTGLTSVTIPERVSKIGLSVFQDCTNLETLIFNAEDCSGEGFKPTYGYSSTTTWLQNCTSLKNVIFGETVKRIPEKALNQITSYGDNIENVTIGSNVSEIGGNAFYNSTKIKHFFYNGTADDWKKIIIGRLNDRLTDARDFDDFDGTYDNAWIHFKKQRSFALLIDGDEYLRQRIMTGEPIDTVETPVREGYTFIGWESDIPEIMPDEDVTINGHWQINSHTVLFDTKGGSKIDPITADYGTEIIAPADPTREGYTFAGWDKAIPETMPDADITITAQWTINSHKITFDTKGGSKIDPITADYGTEIIAPADPTREGYTFVGWDKAIPETMPDTDLTITAQWAINSHKITFDTKGGSKIDPITADYGTEITAPADPTREGYTFTGWDKTIPNTMPDEDLTITATWAINPHTITFDTKGGSKIDPITADYGTDIVKPADPTREGYTFTGWDKAIPETMPDADVTITAKWTINSHTITFDTKGGSKIDPITADYGTEITAPADPTREGYTFAGWDKAIPKTMPDEDVTVTATWQINTHTIVFDTAGGSSIGSITAYYGEEIAAPVSPTREGYTFTGWDKAIPDIMPDKDLTITATWKINSHTITFDTKGGSKIDPITADYGTEIEKPADPKREGYTFNGWDKTIPDIMPDKDLTITATWEINSHTITFDTKGGNEIDPITADYGTEITAPADPTREGYTFAGWDKAIPETMPDADVTITAKWTINSHKITFDTKGGSKIDPITADYGTEIIAPADPTREGYTFAGWDKAIPETMPDADVTITAKWTINSHKITFDTKGGSKIDPITADYGTEITAPADPTREGYTFAGWDKPIPETMPDADITITAQWKMPGGSCGNDLNWSLDTIGGTLTISGSGRMTDYSAQSPAPWHEYGAYIKSIIIGGEVTSIGDHAFSDLDYITGVIIPGSISSVGDHAFSGCAGLTTAVVEDGVMSIGNGTFQGDGKLKTVAFPESLNSIGGGVLKGTAFYNDPANRSDGVLYSGVHLLECDSSKTGICEIRQGTLSIASNAFSGCAGLTGIVVPDSVKSVGGSAFDGCGVLSDVYYHGNDAGWGLIEIGSDNTALTAAARHYPTAAARIEPTCVDVGKTTCVYWSGTDPVEYIEEPDDIPALGHVFTEYIYDENATTKSDGTETAVCERCEATHSRPVPGTRLKCVKSDAGTAVTVEYYDGVFGTEDDNALELRIIKIENKDSRFSSFKANIDGDQVALYEIHMVDSKGESVQPINAQKVSVRIRLPEETLIRDLDKLYIHHRRSDGTTERIKYSTGSLKVENGYLAFEIDSFSDFAVCSFTNIKLFTAAEKKVRFGTRVIITAKAEDLPAGYRLAMAVDGQTVTGNGAVVTYECDRLTGDLNYTVMIVDREGDVARLSDGHQAVSEGKVVCNKNLFIRIAAFFRKLFGIVRTVEIVP